jgi:hypothetical protein
MTGSVTWEVVFGLLVLIGFIFGVWFRVETRINVAESNASNRAALAQAKADLIATQLANYQTHVAETYANKDGVTRQFESLAHSMVNIGERMEKRLDGVNERLDRFIEAGKHMSSMGLGSNS